MTDDAGALQCPFGSQVFGRLMLYCVSQGTIDSFLRPQPAGRILTGPLSKGLLSSSDMIHCGPDVVPDGFSGIGTQGTPYPVRSNDDIRLAASNDVSHFVPCRLHTEVAMRAPADEIDTQFNALFSTFAILTVFSRDLSSASCVVTAARRRLSQDPPRNMLFGCSIAHL